MMSKKLSEIKSRVDVLSITGIEDLNDLPKLKKLTVSSNSNLTSLPNLSNLSNLKELIITNNENLTELPDLSNLPKLENLTCSNNKLKKLSISSNLQFLNCANNELIEITISTNLSYSTQTGRSSELMRIDCANNQLTVLPDLSEFSNLTILTCANNELTKLPALPISIKNITISIDQIGLLINENDNPTDALIIKNDNQAFIKLKNFSETNTQYNLYKFPSYRKNNNVEIIINDIDMKRFIKEQPPPNENVKNFYYDKILNGKKKKKNESDETYESLITDYNKKLNILLGYEKINFTIIQNCPNFEKYVSSIEEKNKLKQVLEEKELDGLTIDALNIYKTNQFAGKKSKKSKKTRKTKKSKKTMKSKKKQ